jgi:hypothetical protein
MNEGSRCSTSSVISVLGILNFRHPNSVVQLIVILVCGSQRTWETRHSFTSLFLNRIELCVQMLCPFLLLCVCVVCVRERERVSWAVGRDPRIRVIYVFIFLGYDYKNTSSFIIKHFQNDGQNFLFWKFINTVL